MFSNLKVLIEMILRMMLAYLYGRICSLGRSRKGSKIH